MAGNSLVVWQNSYSVGIKLIDEQHMELINWTNKLFDSCIAGQEQSGYTFLETIHETVDYVKYHFTTEEKVMERVNYPHFREHKQEHTNFVWEVFRKVKEFHSSKILAPITFVYFLRDWVLRHIAVSDRRTGQYLLALHRRGQLHRMTVKVKRDDATNRFIIG